MHSHSVKDATSASWFLSGPGNARHHKYKDNHVTSIQWQVRQRKKDFDNDFNFARNEFCKKKIGPVYICRSAVRVTCGSTRSNW